MKTRARGSIGKAPGGGSEGDKKPVVLALRKGGFVGLQHSLAVVPVQPRGEKGDRVRKGLVHAQPLGAAALRGHAAAAPNPTTTTANLTAHGENLEVHYAKTSFKIDGMSASASASTGDGVAEQENSPPGSGLPSSRATERTQGDPSMMSPQGSVSNRSSGTPLTPMSPHGTAYNTAENSEALSNERQQQSSMRSSKTASAGSDSARGDSSSNATTAGGRRSSLQNLSAGGRVIRIRRSEEMKVPSTDRFNLDNRNLTSCPVLEGEENLKMLNLQSNQITEIANLALPRLVFLDLYNNEITRISGLEGMPFLRVLMLGRNKIQKLEGLKCIPQLDVLDLHNNQISSIENISHLTELRVLNLSGNHLKTVSGVKDLRSLTEINLRRNMIHTVEELDALPSLQRVFLSNNDIRSVDAIASVCRVRSLTDLCLDGNPIGTYRHVVIDRVKSLRHLDLRRITDDERRVASVHTRREEQRQAEKAIRELAANERKDAIQRIKESWEKPREKKCGLTEYNCDTHVLTIRGEEAVMPAGLFESAQPTPPTERERDPPANEPRGGGGRDGYSRRVDRSAGGARDRDRDRQPPPAERAPADTHEDSSDPTAPTASSVNSVRLEYISISKVVQKFLAAVLQMNNVKSLWFSHNNICSLAQLAAFSRSSTIRELGIVNNNILITPLQRELGSVVFPNVTKLNDHEITTEERTAGRGKFAGFAKLLSVTPTALARARNNATAPPQTHALAFMPREPQSEDPTRKIATHYIKAVLTHAAAIDSKIQLLNRQWDSILNQLVLAAATAPHPPTNTYVAE